MKTKRVQWTWQYLLPYVLLLCGVVGMVASFALTYDKIHVLQNPGYQPSCNLNPVLSCQSVMQSPQANLFGVPNTIFGLIAFSMLSMFAVVLLAGATFKKWLWLGAWVAALVGAAFMHYLFFQAAFRLHVICPWCFTVWMITIPVFVGVTVYGIRVVEPGLLRYRVLKLVDKYCADILGFWYAVIFMTLLVKFWYYWETLL